MVAEIFYSFLCACCGHRCPYNTMQIALAMALKQENTADHMSILTDGLFCINSIRKYKIDPAAYKQHLRKDLLQQTNQLL